MGKNQKWKKWKQKQRLFANNKAKFFEPTGANDMVGSYTSLKLSVCLSLLQNSNWTKILISGLS